MWGVMWGAPTILRVAVRMFSSPCVTLICMTGSQGARPTFRHSLPLAVLRSTTPLSRVSRDTDPPAPYHKRAQSDQDREPPESGEPDLRPPKSSASWRGKTALNASAIALKAESRPDGDHRPDRSTVS